MRVAARHPCVAMRFEQRSAGERPGTERRIGVDARQLPFQRFPGLTVPFGKARLGGDTHIVLRQQMTPEVTVRRAALETLALHVRRTTDDPHLLGAIAGRMDALASALAIPGPVRGAVGFRSGSKSMSFAERSSAVFAIIFSRMLLISSSSIPPRTNHQSNGSSPSTAAELSQPSSPRCPSD